MYISGIFAAIVAKPTSRYFGIKITCGIYSILGILACLWIHWGTEDNQSFKSIQIYFIAIMIGSGGAGMLISSLSIIAEMIGQNTQSSAFVYGAISLVDKLSNGIAMIIIQHCTPTIKAEGRLSPEEFYSNVMSWVCSSFGIAVFLTIVSMIPIKIGKLRKSSYILPRDDNKLCLTDNMEIDHSENI